MSTDQSNDAEVETYLLERGYRCYGPRSYDAGAVLFQRPAEDEPCLRINVYAYIGRPGRTEKAYEIDVYGERRDGVAIQAKMYSFCGAELMRRLPEMERVAVAIWRAAGCYDKDDPDGGALERREVSGFDLIAHGAYAEVDFWPQSEVFLDNLTDTQIAFWDRERRGVVIADLAAAQPKQQEPSAT